MSYRSVLPLAFAAVVQVPEAKLEEATRLLLTSDHFTPNGSSFAVTSDMWMGTRLLWVSAASAARLVVKGDMPIEAFSGLQDKDDLRLDLQSLILQARETYGEQ